jgi:LmbE family N-acetylglucosaminyl deacetylase
MADSPLRLLIIGAHPDDADHHAGGLAALYRAAGHVVKMVSLTNGEAGHQSLRGTELIQRRRAEAADSGSVIGASYLVFNNPDGQLLPTLECRNQVIRLLRSFQPDLVLTHRPNDYHPDHRYTSQLVQDAAYMVTVPAVVPDLSHLPHNPVIAYLVDDFQKPYPFRPSVVVAVDNVFDQIVAMLHCHVSQFYEWLPFNSGQLEQVPAEDSARRRWLGERTAARLRGQADRYRELLIELYGAERGARVQYAEPFEPCEYGAPLTETARRRLFPFVG